MSAYPPPNENLSIFDSNNFHGNTAKPETIARLSQYFLQHPLSQGSETINGSLTATNQITANTNIVMKAGSGGYIQFPNGTQQTTAAGATAPALSAVLTAGSTATNSITLNNSGTGSNVISLLPNASASNPTITLTDGTTTNTIDNNGYTTRNTTTNATHFLNFSDSSATGTGAIQKTGGISCNPNTNTITATTFSGNMSGTATITNVGDSAFYYPVFVENSGNQVLKIESNLSGGINWNPGFDYLRVPTITGNQTTTYGLNILTIGNKLVKITPGLSLPNGPVTFANGATLSAGIKYTTYANGGDTTYTLPITALNSLTSVTSSVPVNITLPDVTSATAPINYTQVPIYVQNASAYAITLTNSPNYFQGLYGNLNPTQKIPQGGTIGVYWDPLVGGGTWCVFSVSGYNFYDSLYQDITATSTLLRPVKSIYYIDTLAAITIVLPPAAQMTGVVMTFRRIAVGVGSVVTFNLATGASNLIPYTNITPTTSFRLSEIQYTTTITSDGVYIYQLQTI